MTRPPSRPLLALTVSGCVLLSIGVLAMLLSSRRPADDGLPVLSGLPTSAVGYSALATLLRSQGIPVTYAPIDGGNLHHRIGLVIIAPVSPRIEFPGPDTHVHAHIMYIPPKWRLRRDPGHPGWVRSPGMLDDKSALHGFNTNIPPSIFLHMSVGSDGGWWGNPRYGLSDLPEPGPVARLRSFGFTRLRAMLAVSDDHMVLLGSGPFLLLSDPDFLDNLGMADRRTAMMAVQLIDRLRLGGPVWIAPSYVLTLPPGGARPFSMAFLPPFLAVTLCMLLVAILMAWQGLVRFGPVRSGTRLMSGKSGLIDSTAGLIERTRRTPRMLPTYAALMRELALGTARAGNDPNRLLRQMQTKRRTTDDFFALEQKTQVVRTPSDLIDMARALRRWKQEMVHGRH